MCEYVPGTNTHSWPPIVTVALVPNEEPVMVKIVPPAVAPDNGLTEEIAGCE